MGLKLSSISDKNVSPITKSELFVITFLKWWVWKLGVSAWWINKSWIEDRGILFDSK